MDYARCGQFWSEESRHIRMVGATGDGNRRAGRAAISSTTAAIATSHAEQPAARSQRKRVLEAETGKALLGSLEPAPTRRSRVCTSVAGN